jgi:hypothetical protein
MTTTTAAKRLRFTPVDVQILVLALEVLQGDEDWSTTPDIVNHAEALRKQLKEAM